MHYDERVPAGSSVLICQVGGLRCALPVEHVIETMRPLRCEPLAGAPEGVQGAAIVRGAAVPVIDAGRLLGGPAVAASRWVLLRLGERRAALAVGEVLGVRRLEGAALAAMPPLLSGAASEVAGAMGRLDGELLVVLRGGRLVDESTWAAVGAVKA